MSRSDNESVEDVVTAVVSTDWEICKRIVRIPSIGEIGIYI